MERVFKTIEYDHFVTCPLCGESAKSLTYRSDNVNPLCSRCAGGLAGYSEASVTLTISKKVADTVKAGISENRFSAWYIYGRKSGHDYKAQECIAWSHDWTGYPVFDAKKSLKEALAVKGEFIGTLISVEGLTIPPAWGSLGSMDVSNSPLVCLISHKGPEYATYAELREASGTTPVLVIPEA